MTTNREAWLSGVERLAAAGIDSARLDARVLLACVMDLGTGELLTAKDPSPEQIARYEELLERRLAREPVAYITGEREFWSLPFAVGPGVLIPRPETETLLEEAFRLFPDREAPLNVLDLGTGSGCLLIAFLKNFPKARGIGVDRSAEALGWARRNAEAHGVADRMAWQEGGWGAVDGATFDLVLSNPPYLTLAEAETLPPEIARYEPANALLAGADGLNAYRALAPLFARYVKPNGRVIVEIGAGQADAVSRILAGHGLEIMAVRADLAGIPRSVAAVRV
jgi:release factor glutamine methyltransferase